ncbi:membrane integrity-associated transporter subunit PqiC [Candidatus Sumerlaeota bacterium]|nr:membrane integrity-associated transporter subunit PqiC [Candidatus Sumerlaeota bacterium]
MKPAITPDIASQCLALALAPALALNRRAVDRTKKSKSKSKSKSRLGCILLCAALLAGCLPRLDYPQKREFQLELNTQDNLAPAAETLPALRIVGVLAAPPLDEHGFIYRRGEHEYIRDYYNEFFSRPAQNLEWSLRQGLEQSRQFKAVLGKGDRIEADWLLELRLNALHADVRRGETEDGKQRPGAVIELQAHLSRDLPGGAELVMQKTYREFEPAQSAKPDALVAAWNRALTRVLNALIKDLRNSPMNESILPAGPSESASYSIEGV